MKLVVLCGGVSAERDVSLSSGAAVADGLVDAGFDVEIVDIQSVRAFLEAWPSYGADGVFIALHGGWGEDGRLQAALEAWGIRYTGTDARGSMLAMHKDISRDIFVRRGIPIPPGVVVHKQDRIDLAELMDRWGKVVVKPSSEGSTFGVTITSDVGEAAAGLRETWRYGSTALVEKYVPGVELTVAVFDGDRPDTPTMALPPIEIRPMTGFYDYDSKYTKGRTEYICPAPLAADVDKRLRELAVAAYESVGCSAFGRVDARYNEDDGICILEVNTIPGMTATSLVPKAAAAGGWSFPGCLRRIVNASFGLAT